MGFWTGIKNRANITPSNLTLLIHPHRSEAEDSPEIAAGGGGNGTETSDASRTHRSPTVTAECSARVRGLSTGERMRRLAEVRTLDRNDLMPLDWLKHAQEEAMDFVLYLEKLKKELADLK